MRRLQEIAFDIDGVQRRMAQIVIAQSDYDAELARLDRRLRYLERERTDLSVKKSESENEI